MSVAVLPRLSLPRLSRDALAPLAVTGLAYLVLFWVPISTLVGDWFNNPDAGHGLLLAPLAVYLVWKQGIDGAAKGQPRLGIALLCLALVLRYMGGLAAELFTMRASLLLATFGLATYYLGSRQLLRWWLPCTLLALSVPLPAVVLGSISLPLQLQASEIGSALLQWRGVPVLLNGNVIHLPGRTLFVTEACSGLRSLSSLIALGVLIGGLWLRSPVSRTALVLASIPIAIVLNGIRVFLTGFLVVFVDPSLAEGFMHMTEGWIIFVTAFIALGAIAWLIARLESWFVRPLNPALS